MISRRRGLRKGFLVGISIATLLAIGTVGVRANDSILKAAAEQWVVAGHDYGNAGLTPADRPYDLMRSTLA